MFSIKKKNLLLLQIFALLNLNVDIFNEKVRHHEIPDFFIILIKTVNSLHIIKKEHFYKKKSFYLVRALFEFRFLQLHFIKLVTNVNIRVDEALNITNFLFWLFGKQIKLG